MIASTRLFVISSLVVLLAGVGTGLVAYYAGFPGAFARTDGPEELHYVPRDSAVVAYADVRDLMTSEFRRKMHESMPIPENGQREFQNETGIDVETDIDRVVACLKTGGPSSDVPGAGMVLARGRFNAVKIEALMREHGAKVEDYQGKRLVVADASHGPRTQSFALAFVEPGLVAVGNAGLVRAALDLRKSGQDATSNEDLMKLVRSLDGGNAWAVGRLDALRSTAKLPEAVASQLPAITWFSVSGHVNGGIRGVIRAETRDEEAANTLRDLVRGFMALGKLQAGAKPEWREMMQSLELGGTGKTVVLSFAFPSEVFDMLGKAARPGDRRVGH